MIAGLYIHIPYCKRKCSYCNFHFSTNLNTIDLLLEALVSEITQRSNENKDYKIQSIYFGGGTPSILNSRQLELLFTALNSNYSLIQDCEISIECNPDDIDLQLLNNLKSFGVNRISLGVQSFDQEDLEWMNRSHSALQSAKAIESIKNSGFDNFSIDLMYGLPNSSVDKWKYNLNSIIQYDCPHFSAYALTIEERTTLIHKYRNKQIFPADDISSLEQMNILLDFCESNNYEDYEISNFAKQGYRSRHNSAYWNGIPYLGFGPSAHSYSEHSRRWNIANNNLYIKCIKENIAYFDFEELSVKDRYNEYIMLNLRKKEGIPIQKLEQLYPQFMEEFNQHIVRLADMGEVIIENSHIRLTRSGKAQADRISSELFRLSD